MTKRRKTTGTLQPNESEHAVYTQRFLKIYDALVLGLYAERIWRCPRRRTVGLYREHLRRRHLDVGPGTGYFLQRAAPAGLELTLLDASSDALVYAAERLRELGPATVEADVCERLPELGPFDSIGLNYVLHCLGGPQRRKAAAVRSLAAVLEPDGVLFGATVLADPEYHTWFSRLAFAGLNRQGIFSNREDTRAMIHGLLSESFEEVHLEVVGAVGVFAAHRPRTLDRGES